MEIDEEQIRLFVGLSHDVGGPNFFRQCSRH
jgi:hypothetical protein